MPSVDHHDPRNRPIVELSLDNTMKAEMESLEGVNRADITVSGDLVDVVVFMNDFSFEARRKVYEREFEYLEAFTDREFSFRVLPAR